MDLKTWTELSELVLKIAVPLGAAIWAFSLLFILRQRDTALAALHKTDADTRKADAEARKLEAEYRESERKEQALLEAEAISVDIKPTIRPNPDGEGYIILAVVKLNNLGSRIKRIKWRDELPAFYVRLVRFGADGKPKYDSPMELRVPLTLDPNSEAVSHVIRGGGTECVTFALCVLSAGLYLLSFRAVLDEGLRVESVRVGANLPVAWTGNRYVFVGETPILNASGADD
ncbi:MAG: hypothetical protein ACLP4V_09120 [Methylocella sp.]